MTVRTASIGAGLALALMLIIAVFAGQSREPAASDPATAPAEMPDISGTSEAAEAAVPEPVKQGSTAPDSASPDPAVDGAVSLDVGGGIVPDRALRDLFDHFLAGASRHGVDTSRSRLERDLVQRGLAEVERAQVLALFDRYVDYLRVLEDRLLASQPEDAEQRFLLVYQVRRDQLGPALADAFFAEDEAMDRAYLSGGFAETPSAIRSRALLDVGERASLLREDAADPVAVAELYREEFGDAAASRMRRLEEQRSAWNDRVDVFLEERRRLLEAGLAEADRTQAMADLVEAHFDEREALRLPAELQQRQ